MLTLSRPWGRRRGGGVGRGQRGGGRRRRRSRGGRKREGARGWRRRSRSRGGRGRRDRGGSRRYSWPRPHVRDPDCVYPDPKHSRQVEVSLSRVGDHDAGLQNRDDRGQGLVGDQEFSVRGVERHGEVHVEGVPVLDGGAVRGLSAGGVETCRVFVFSQEEENTAGQR